MGKGITGSLAVFNRLYKEMDEIYHIYAKQRGISDTALWLLYSLCERKTEYTQKEFCEVWHYPPQTVNSILKNLQRQGLLELEPSPDNRKNKWIVVTEKGEELVKNAIEPLIAGEERAFQALTENERKTLLALTEKYVELLRSEVGKIK